MKELKIEYIDVDLLTPYENNARTHGKKDVDSIEASIDEFGFNDPIGIWGENNVIVEGHGRLLAAKQHGINKVPCIRLDHLTEEQRRAYALAHNKTAELSSWDEVMKKAEIKNIKAVDMRKFGFKVDAEPIDIEESDYNDSQSGELQISRGEIYALGEHRLMCGDSTSADDVDALMGGEIADVCLTSPPYGASNSSRIRSHYVKGKSTPDSFYNDYADKKEDWFDVMCGFMAVAVKHTKCQMVNIQMLADNKSDLIKWVALNAATFCDLIVWDKIKSIPQMQPNVLNNEFEFVFIFGNKTRTIPYANFHGNKSNMIRLGVRHNEYSDIHRAVFPVGLPSALMDITQKAKSYFDPFGGTGTTLIACEQLNRKCYMMELDPQYCGVIINRWEKLTGNKAERIEEAN